MKPPKLGSVYFSYLLFQDYIALMLNGNTALCRSQFKRLYVQQTPEKAPFSNALFSVFSMQERIAQLEGDKSKDIARDASICIRVLYSEIDVILTHNTALQTDFFFHP